jgi:hypothetical protein
MSSMKILSGSRSLRGFLICCPRSSGLHGPVLDIHAISEAADGIVGKSVKFTARTVVPCEVRRFKQPGSVNPECDRRSPKILILFPIHPRRLAGRCDARPSNFVILLLGSLLTLVVPVMLICQYTQGSLGVLHELDWKGITREGFIIKTKTVLAPFLGSPAFSSGLAAEAQILFLRA